MIADNIKAIKDKLPSGTKLVAVSKFHPVESILEAYNAGQRLFGENRPQELQAKVINLSDRTPGLEFHFLGHLQTNKLKMVLPYVSMVESVDSLHLLKSIDEWGRANDRVTDVLLELHIAAEQSKQGFVEEEILELMFNASDYCNVRICGLMGMATHTDDIETVSGDFERISDFFAYLQDLFPEYKHFNELSIGMSEDWPVALEYGATIVRIGTAIFGERTGSVQSATQTV